MGCMDAWLHGLSVIVRVRPWQNNNRGVYSINPGVYRRIYRIDANPGPFPLKIALNDKPIGLLKLKGKK
jgi:hypothetical protein